MSNFKYTLITCFDNDIHLTHRGVEFANPISTGEHLIFDDNKFLVGEVIHKSGSPGESVLFVTPDEGNWTYPPEPKDQVTF